MWSRSGVHLPNFIAGRFTDPSVQSGCLFSAAHSITGTPFSFSAWVYLPRACHELTSSYAFPTHRAIAALSAATSTGEIDSIALSDAGYACFTRTSSTNNLASVRVRRPWNLDEWTHVAGLFNGTSALNVNSRTVWVNGLFTGTNSASGTHVSIGSQINIGGSAYSGPLRNAFVWQPAFYNRILTTAEVRQLAAGVNPRLFGPVHYFDLQENSWGMVPDQVGTAHLTAKAVNYAWVEAPPNKAVMVGFSSLPISPLFPITTGAAGGFKAAWARHGGRVIGGGL